VSVEISTGKNGCCSKFRAVGDSRYIIQIQWKYQGIGEKSERLEKCPVKRNIKESKFVRTLNLLCLLARDRGLGLATLTQTNSNF
jgi:hypothetical protein